MAIRKQYVMDENMNPVAIQIPIDDWNKIEQKLREPIEFKMADLSKYKGIIELSENPLEFQKRIRA